MPGQNEFVAPPEGIKTLQEERSKQEEALREFEGRVAESEEKEKYWKIARQMYPDKSDKEIDKEIEKDIIARLSKILEVDDGK